MLGKKKQKARRSVGHFDTLISTRTTVEGDVHFSGGLHLEGRIHGKLVAEDGSDAVLRIAESGEVTGDVSVPHIIINGSVHGDVYASAHLELAEKASIVGNVYYNVIEMAMGASVNGSLVHQKEPVGLLTRSHTGLSADAGGDEADSEKLGADFRDEAKAE